MELIQLTTEVQSGVGDVATYLRVVLDELGVQGVDGDGLLDLGLSSLQVMEVVGGLERHFGVRVAPMVFTRNPGLEQLASHIADVARASPPSVADGETLSAPTAQGDVPAAAFGLSLQQQAYCAGRGSDLELGNVSTHGYLEFDTHGLDIDRFVDCWNVLIARHDQLRTVVDVEQMTAEVVRSGVEYRPRIIDLSGSATVDDELSAVRASLAAEVRPADQWPLFDWVICVLDGDRARLHLSVDALICDYHSLQILLDELSILYVDPAASLRTLDLTFSKYLELCAQADQSQAAREDWDYWRERAATLPGPPALALAVDPTTIDTPSFARVERSLTAAQTAALIDLATVKGLTLPATVLAAYTEVLARWSGSDHFLVNLPTINRRAVHPDAAHLVGEFASFLLVEVDQTGADTFAQRAQRLSRQLWSDLAHSDVEGVRVVREIMRHKGFDSAIAPVVFNGLAALPEYPGAPSGFLGGAGRQRYRITQTPQTWLDCQLEIVDDQLVIGWDHVTELFDGQQIDDMVDTLIELLVGLADPARWDRRDPLVLPATHSGGVLRGPIAAHPTDLLGPIMTAAQSNPDAAAIVSGTSVLTYRQLLGHLETEARRLTAAGVGPGDRVVVIAAASAGQALTALAILAVGGVYVPLYPHDGTDRLAAMLAAIEPVVVIGADGAVDQGYPTMAIREPATSESVLAQQDHTVATPIAVRSAAADACIIFTSGSTGTPKGVRITAGGLTNALAHTIGEFGIGSADRVLAVTRPNHDMALFDLLGVLRVGGAMIVPDVDRGADAAHWARLIVDHGVTIWNSVPAAMEMLTTADPGACARLRLAFLGGDWIPVGWAATLIDSNPDLTLVSVGGPTETTLWNIRYRVDSLEPDRASVPYGTPIANTDYHVVDDQLRASPDGVTGELCCSGVGVSPGYVGGVGAESFVTHPDTGERWYRTGDLGAIVNGVVEFVGRVDRQIKIRGHRVEPAEVERVVTALAGVAAAVVVGIENEDSRGYRGLAAFLTATDHDSEVEALVDEVASACRESLPAHLRPSFVEVLGQLPRTANGKIDRRQLADRAGQRSRNSIPAATTVGAGDRLTHEIAATFAAALQVPTIDPSDDFFAVGGNSLVATKIVVALRDSLGVQVELRDVFGCRTPVSIASLVRTRRFDGGVSDTAAPVRAAVHPEQRHNWFGLTAQQQAYAVGRLGDFELGSGATHAYVEFEGRGLSVAKFTRAWNLLVARHDMLRAVVSIERNEQRVLAEVAELEFEVLDLRGADRRDVEAALAGVVAKLGAQQRDPEQWPLYELILTQHDDDVTRVHLSIDALIYDHRSWGVLVPELQILHDDPQAVLPPLDLTFRDYVGALDQATDSQRYHADREYWQSRIATLPPAPELPLAQAPSAVTDPTFARLEHLVAPAQWSDLKAYAAQHGLSPSGLLLAAYAEILGRWSGNRSFTLNLPYAGRLPVHPQVDAIVGQLSSVVLVEVDRSAGTTFAQRAVALQQQLWDDLSHPWYPGVAVLRDLMRTYQVHDRPLMPVVMTSALALGSGFTDDDGFLHPIGGITQTPQVWLDFQVNEDRGTLRLDWDHVVELFPAGMLGEMFDAFIALIDDLSVGRGWSDTVVDVLPPHSGAASGAGVGPNRAVVGDPVDLLAETIRTRPTAIAVAGEGRSLTFADLDRAVNHLAAQLIEGAEQIGEVVAVLVSPGPDQVIAVQAALRAGIAYLPLDAELPAARLAGIVADMHLRYALIDADHAETVQRLGLSVLTVGDTPDRVDAVPSVSVAADAPAYVIMTSGSTGTPKGVVVGRGALANFVSTVLADGLVGHADRVFMVTALHHDLSVFHTVAAPCAGATVVTCPEGFRNPAQWAATVVKQRITTWMTVPAMFEMMLDAGGADLVLPALRTVILGGDWIPVPLVARIATAVPHGALVSIGGPTETTVWNITHAVGELPSDAVSVPYGRPTANNTYRVLDAIGAPCPDWVTGEMWCEGANVALGYRGAPELTAASFVIADDGVRRYRTGDLGRFVPTADGAVLEFRGRRDNQVKVRGFRIELGEIETALLAIPAVLSAVVVGVAETDGHRQRGLAAFVITDAAAAGDGPRPEEMRAVLADTIPTYAVPDQITVVEAFPLSPNGKVDRSKLAGMARASASRSKVGGDRDTDSGVVRALSDLFADVLEVPDVGGDDDIFDLGGNSLIANRIVVAIAEVFPGADLAIPDVLTARTPASLAETLVARMPTARRIGELYLRVAAMTDDEITTALDERNRS